MDLDTLQALLDLVEAVTEHNKTARDLKTWYRSTHGFEIGLAIGDLFPQDDLDELRTQLQEELCLQ